MVTNHFLAADAADQYDRHRPYFHPLVFKRLTELTSTAHFDRALDIGCGTGQSTQAMAAVSGTVIGLDASEAMLQGARRRGLQCVRASAERLPLADRSFDLVGIGLAFHWFDRPAVMREARRVLRAGGWLLIFNSYFGGVMREHDAFATWWQEYLAKYPSPPRHPAPLTSEVVAATGFREAASETFVHEQRYSRDELIGYVMTQSNVANAVEAGLASRQSTRAWMMQTLEPFFEAPAGTFVYNGTLSVYQAAGYLCLAAGGRGCEDESTGIR